MQRPCPGHVRFGSKADIEARSIDVRFTSGSGHQLLSLGCVSAKSGHPVYCRILELPHLISADKARWGTSWIPLNCRSNLPFVDSAHPTPNPFELISPPGSDLMLRTSLCDFLRIDVAYTVGIDCVDCYRCAGGISGARGTDQKGGDRVHNVSFHRILPQIWMPTFVAINLTQKIDTDRDHCTTRVPRVC